MSDMIQAVGEYRQKNGNKATVEFINGQWAFGYDSSDDWNVWSCSSGESDQESGPDGAFNIVAPWTAFSVGDLVLVDNPSSEWHKHYGEVTHVSLLLISVKIGEARPGFRESELTRVTLPAPLPEGFRLKPRNVKPVKGVDIGIVSGFKEWAVVNGWEGRDAAGWESFRGDQYFFAEPIPKPEPPQLFSISDHGLGIYQTRDGREATVDSQYESSWGGVVEDERREWENDGTQIPGHQQRGDLVRYIGPLPEAPEQWTPTADIRVEVEQRWECNGQSEWRAVEIKQ